MNVATEKKQKKTITLYQQQPMGLHIRQLSGALFLLPKSFGL